MIKYIATATAAKAFSMNPYTKRLYRRLGNILMSRSRNKEGLPERYRNRAQFFLELINKYDAVHDGSNLLELGTGWLPWESTCIRLIYDVNTILFDVWDNRLLDVYKLYFKEFADTIDTVIDIPLNKRTSVHSLLSCISEINSFEELYRLLGFQYIVEQSGSLKCLQDESCDLIFSFDVLEHVNREILPEYLRDVYRLLKPGGYSIHQIDIADHLAYFDTSVHKKYYLRHSDKVWNRAFENEVLYFNRVQRPDWMSMFRDAGLVLMEEMSEYYNTESIEVDIKYKNLNKQDRDCILMKVVHRKPI